MHVVTGRLSKARKQEAAGQEGDSRETSIYRKLQFRNSKAHRQTWVNPKLETNTRNDHKPMISYRLSQCHSENPETSQTQFSTMPIISFVQVGEELERKLLL